MAEKRVHRRLTAILAADVVGYSRMMREDEARTLEQFKVLRKEVFDPRTAGHHGRIVKTIEDGMLVEITSAVDSPERSTGRPLP
jgi:adenylate cyclase